MSKRKRSSTTWATCKAAMKNWPRDGIVGLVRELYELSSENRGYLHARLLAIEGNDDAKNRTLDAARRELLKLLSPRSVWGGDFKHMFAKRIIDRYEKATQDSGTVADLILADIEQAFGTFQEVGDYEPLADHLYAMLARLQKTLEQLDPEMRRPFVERLCGIAERWGASFGWGISDELEDVACRWSEAAGLGERIPLWKRQMAAE